MNSNKNNNDTPLILTEFKQMNCHTRYIVYERNRGRTVRYDDNYIQDSGKSVLIEDIITARNIHIALNKALAELSPDEYRIISECFFESNNKPNLTKLAKKHGISRQAYTSKRDKILIKLKSLVISHYEEF